MTADPLYDPLTENSGRPVSATSSDTDLVIRDLDRGVLLLTWNRPERNNGWTIDLEDAYFGALIEASADRDVQSNTTSPNFGQFFNPIERSIGLVFGSAR